MPDDSTAAGEDAIREFTEMGVGEKEAGLLMEGGIEGQCQLLEATQAELEAIKGIGPVTTRKIMDIVEEWKARDEPGQHGEAIIVGPAKAALGLLRSMVMKVVRTPTSVNGCNDDDE